MRETGAGLRRKSDPRPVLVDHLRFPLLFLFLSFAGNLLCLGSLLTRVVVNRSSSDPSA